MERKLIRQGDGAYTISLPAKWVKQHSLTKGDSVIVEELTNEITISLNRRKQKKKEITLVIPTTKHTATMSSLMNAYRSGFDRIFLVYKGNEKEIAWIVDHFLMGFEMHKETSRYVLESVSEPDYDNFNNLINRQFFILKSILEDIFVKNISAKLYKLRRYDAFLKRCITKNKLLAPQSHYLWQLLSDINYAGRICFHLQKKTNLTKVSKKAKTQILKEWLALLAILQKSYLKKDMVTLYSVYDKEVEINKLFEEKIFSVLDTTVIHYLKTITRNIYLINSSIMALLQYVQIEN